MAGEFFYYVLVLWNGISVTAKNYEWISLMELFIELILEY